MKPIYLDHNSTTPVLPQVVRAMADCYHRHLANPASPHWLGQRARSVLEQVRDEIGTTLGAKTDSLDADRVVFTSGATEANNLVIRGLDDERSAGHAIVSAIEHPSIAEPAAWLRSRGWTVDHLPVGPDGVVLFERLPSMLRPETRIVSVMLANHETGVIQPVRQIASICRDAGVPVHTDATQAVGKQTVDFRSLGVDALTASAHKFHGPRGIGVLVARRDLPLRAIQFGGFQQEGLRPGTESIALPVGMYAALCSWAAEPEARVLRLGELRDSLESQLAAGWPELVIHGRTASRLPHVSNVAFVGLNRQALLMAMDAAHVAASAGSACASGSPEPSPTLVAMGCSKVQIEGSIRLSVGATTTMAEIDQAVGRILNIANDLGTRNRQRKTLREARKSSRESL